MRANGHGTVPPVVSVVIPTYNRGHVVTRALESVLRQTFSTFEVLVVDDGSTDGTRAAVARLTDPRIRYIPLPENRGVSAARNRGLRESRGELIAFLDSDDEWMPRKLELQTALFAGSAPEVGLTYTAVENVDSRGGSWITAPRFRGDIYADLLLRNVIHGCSGVMIRRSVVDRVGYFDESIPAIEDYDYWLRAARHFEVDFVPEPLLRYHDPLGEERKSLDVPENLDARNHLFRKHRKEMQKAGVAHHFLMESARRHKTPSGRHRPGARRLAIRAALYRPLWWEPYSFLLGTLPAPVLRVLRFGRRLVERLPDSG